MSDGTHVSNLAGNIRVQSGAPSSPQTGELWFDSDSNNLFVYNGTAWVGTTVLTTSTSTSSTSTSTSTTA